MKKYFFLILIILSCVIFACSRHEKPRDKENANAKPKPFSHILYFAGTIQPLKTRVITSPADGVIQDMLFHYGDAVLENQPLFMISSEKFQTDYKTALLQFIKAKNEYANNKSQLTESEFLHKNELISDDEFKAKQSAFYNAQLSLLQSKDALTVMLKQLVVQGFKLDELRIENIDKITQALNAQGDSQKLRIISPVKGEVLLPVKVDGTDSEAKKINKGDQVKQGDVLAVIGDVSGITLHVSVNEFNINEIKVGQKVKVTGAAFSDFVLEGEISGIDKQGQAGQGGMPLFPVEILVPHLTKEQQEIIRMGMSAKVEINIDEVPALLVPISAVAEKNGEPVIKIQNEKTGKITEFPVKTGETTLDSVVIKTKIPAGEKVVAAAH